MALPRSPLYDDLDKKEEEELYEVDATTLPPG